MTTRWKVLAVDALYAAGLASALVFAITLTHDLITGESTDSFADAMLDILYIAIFIWLLEQLIERINGKNKP